MSTGNALHDELRRTVDRWPQAATATVSRWSRQKVGEMATAQSRRVLAEGQWLELRALLPRAQIQMFRLAGIYGPGRSVVDDLTEGTARRIVKPGQVFNRIHVDDIARVVVRLIHTCGQTDVGEHVAFTDDVVRRAHAALAVDPPTSWTTGTVGSGQRATWTNRMAWKSTSRPSCSSESGR